MRTSTTGDMTAATSQQIRSQRRSTPHDPRAALIILACLWPKMGENLGTLCRTMDALGGALTYPAGSQPARALAKGNTIGIHNSPLVPWFGEPMDYLEHMWSSHVRIVGVELARHAVPLADLEPASDLTVAVLGNESTGIPSEAFEFFSEVVEIPMAGVGSSLNVAVAGSLVAYKLAGLS